jgi:hypothetical protein
VSRPAARFVRNRRFQAGHNYPRDSYSRDRAQSPRRACPNLARQPNFCWSCRTFHLGRRQEKRSGLCSYRPFVGRRSLSEKHARLATDSLWAWGLGRWSCCPLVGQYSPSEKDAHLGTDSQWAPGRGTRLTTRAEVPVAALRGQRNPVDAPSAGPARTVPGQSHRPGAAFEWVVPPSLPVRRRTANRPGADHAGSRHPLSWPGHDQTGRAAHPGRRSSPAGPGWPREPAGPAPVRDLGTGAGESWP